MYSDGSGFNPASIRLVTVFVILSKVHLYQSYHVSQIDWIAISVASQSHIANCKAGITSIVIGHLITHPWLVVMA